MNKPERSITRLHILILILASVLCYANTLKAPFYLDDRPFLLENASIRDMGNIPSFFAGKTSAIASRPVVLTTFALNHLMGKYNPAGYHLFNIALHALACVLLYLLIIRTARLTGYADPDDGTPVVALCASLLFATHPMHTEAVNYISARSSLLVTCFYLLGILLFTKAAESDKRRPVYLTALVLVSLLGMGSGESFITFPLILILYDFCFVSRRDIKAVMGNIKVHLAVLATALYAVFLISSGKSQTFAQIGPIDYFMTQWNVTMTYIRMLILPYGLSFDHDFPTAHALIEWPTIASFAGYIALWIGGLALLKRYPAIGFGILWFTITLLPDSGFVPARFNLSEYRAYLPSAGFLTALVIGIFWLFKRTGLTPRQIALGLIAISIAFGGLSIIRNRIWNDPVAMWQDVVQKAPSNARGHYNLGVEYIGIKQYEQALTEMKATVKNDPSSIDAHYNLGLLLIANSPGSAVKSFERVLALNPGYPNVNVYLGNLYAESRQYDKAITAYEKALSQRKDAGGYVLLGYLYLYKKSDPDHAIGMFEEALKFNPEDENALTGISTAYEKKGIKNKAVEYKNKIVREPAPAPSIESLFK